MHLEAKSSSLLIEFIVSMKLANSPSSNGFQKCLDQHDKEKIDKNYIIDQYVFGNNNVQNKYERSLVAEA